MGIYLIDIYISIKIKAVKFSLLLLFPNVLLNFTVLYHE